MRGATTHRAAFVGALIATIALGSQAVSADSIVVSENADDYNASILGHLSPDTSEGGAAPTIRERTGASPLLCAGAALHHTSSIYDLTVFDPDQSLLETVSKGGGSINGLGRHAAAALQLTSEIGGPCRRQAPNRGVGIADFGSNRSPIRNVVGRGTADPTRSNGSLARVCLRRAT